MSNLACRGTESHGWFDVSPKNSAWDVIHEQAHCHDKAANHQLPIAAAFGIIWIVSTEECSSLTQNLVQICCHSVILNVTATQYTCLLNRVCCPHWLAQWSRHCSCMLIPVHSPQLPGYIDVRQTVLIILTMAGLFLGRPHTLLCPCWRIFIHMRPEKSCGKENFWFSLIVKLFCWETC